MSCYVRSVQASGLVALDLLFSPTVRPMATSRRENVSRLSQTKTEVVCDGTCRGRSPRICLTRVPVKVVGRPLSEAPCRS